MRSNKKSLPKQYSYNPRMFNMAGNEDWYNNTSTFSKTTSHQKRQKES